MCGEYDGDGDVDPVWCGEAEDCGAAGCELGIGEWWCGELVGWMIWFSLSFEQCSCHFQNQDITFTFKVIDCIKGKVC